MDSSDPQSRKRKAEKEIEGRTSDVGGLYDNKRRSRKMDSSRSLSVTGDKERDAVNEEGDEDDEALPILDYKNELMDAVKANQVIVCVGETGSGKSTQIPQYLIDTFGKGKSRCNVGITQPRRVAATSLARRVADELHCKVGSRVGYTVRFDDNSSKATEIKYMTDGILVREALRDHLLSRYDIIMLDEAHERSIHTDILFGLLRNLLPIRPELKLIITSATLNTVKFSKYFHNCPIIEVPGRLFNVTIFHAKEKVTSSTRDKLWEEAVRTVKQIHHKEPLPGDVLVFLPGARDIELANEALLRDNDDSMIVVPLYGALSSEMQQLVFKRAPFDCRKIVLSTNIAETSLTVPGIRYVIDPGFVKQRIYRGDSGLNTLQVVQISRTSAVQRAGRAGRTSEGKCFRLYPKTVFLDDMEEESVPEIKRSNLANTVLYLKVIGIGDVLDFPFLDPPEHDALLDALAMLYYLGAIDEDGKITSLGKQMSDFPLEPSLAKMLITAADLGCALEATIVAAMLSVENVFYLGGQKNNSKFKNREPSWEEQKREAKRQSYFHKSGDHLTFVNVFLSFMLNDSSHNWCKENGIHYRALRTASNIQKQLIDILKQAKIEVSSNCEDADIDNKYKSKALRKSICAGFFVNSAQKCFQGGQEARYKTLADGESPNITNLHPNSALSASATFPNYIVFHELVHTSKAFMRNVTSVKYDWLESYLKRVSDVDLKRLSAGRIIYHANRWKRETDYAPKSSNTTRSSNNNAQKPSSASTSNTPTVRTEDKVAAARARFLARKKK